MSEKKDTIFEKIIDIFKSGRVWILIFFILISLVAVNYTSNTQGVVINGISPNSPAQNAGMSFDSKTSQRDLEKILYVNNEQIISEQQYYELLSSIDENEITIITDKNSLGYTLNFPENSSLTETIGISVRSTPSSNIKLGIELEGGSRIILKATNSNLTDSEYTLLVETLQNRLDVYGASGTKVNKLEDAFSNEKFVIVESISSNKNDIYELIKRQGEFVAKLDNKTAFTGDNIIRVDPSSNRLEGCPKTSSDEYICTYAFTVQIDSAGTDGFYNIAKNLSVIGGHLSEKIEFYLDGNLITALNVADDFKNQKISNPQITVSGNAMPSQDLAHDSALKEVKFLQAILSTQSLPSELEVVQSYSISSSTGAKLLENSFVVALVALLMVASVVALRYRHFSIFVSIFIALITEVIIVFGMAAFLKLAIDLAAIGGLIAAIGTGVDDQIIITDEYFRKRKRDLSSKKRIKNALYIIMIAYFTTLAAMVPLYFAGLNILQGFAFMIIIGVTVGVFITRPAYAAMLRIIMTTREQRKEEKEKDD